MAPPWVQHEEQQKQKQNIHKTTNQKANSEDTLNGNFKEEELDRAINLIKRDSAPGKDQIDYKMLKNLPKKMKRTLLIIYNNIWQTTNHPEE